MPHKVAKLSKESLELVQKAEKKLSELGRDMILIAYESTDDPSGV